MQQSFSVQIFKMLATDEWQSAYSKFIYQNAIQFPENGNQTPIQHELHQQFKQLMKPIYSKYLAKEYLDWHNDVLTIYTQNIQQLIQNESIDLITQFLCLIEFKVFHAEMTEQNILMDLVALELIKREQSSTDQGSDDDFEEEEEDKYFENQRELAKITIEGRQYEEKKEELQKSIKLAIDMFNLPVVDLQQQDIAVDSLGFNQGADAKADDSLKQTVKLRTLRLKQTIPKQAIKLTAEQMMKRKLQAEAIRKAINEI